MAVASNTRRIGHVDCPGGGQVWVDGTTMYVAHMRPPAGTSLHDIADPANPVLLAHVEIPVGWHSHKVRARDGLMIVNHEKFRDGAPEFGGGLGIYDVSRPAAPRLITKWRTGGSGVHRLDFGGRYAYISPTADGFIGEHRRSPGRLDLCVFQGIAARLVLLRPESRGYVELSSAGPLAPVRIHQDMLEAAADRAAARRISGSGGPSRRNCHCRITLPPNWRRGLAARATTRLTPSCAARPSPCTTLGHLPHGSRLWQRRGP